MTNKEKVIDFVVEYINEKEITLIDKSKAFENILDEQIQLINIDSLDIADIIIGIYEKFGIELRLDLKKHNYKSFTFRRIIDETFEKIATDEQALLAIRQRMDSSEAQKDAKKVTSEVG